MRTSKRDSKPLKYRQKAEPKYQSNCPPPIFQIRRCFRFPFGFVSKAVASSSELGMVFIGGMMGHRFRAGVYHSTTLRPIKVLPPHKDLLNIIKVISYEKKFYLFVGSIDGEINVWDINQGFKRIKTMSLKNTVYSIECVQDSVVLGGFFKDFYCWDLKSMELNRIIDTMGNYYFTSMKYVKKGNYLVAMCSKIGEVMCFDWNSGQLIDKRIGHQPSYQVLALDISETEEVMVTGANNGAIKVWDVTKRGVRFSYEIDHRLATEEWKPIVRCVYFLDDFGEQFVGAYSDSLLTFWNRGIKIPVMKTPAFETGTGFVYDKQRNLFFCFDYKNGNGYVLAKTQFYSPIPTKSKAKNFR